MAITFTPSGVGFDVFENQEHLGYVHKGSCHCVEGWKAVSRHLPTRDSNWFRTRKGAVADLQITARRYANA